MTLAFKNTHIDFSYGQHDYNLTAYADKIPVGELNYSLFGDEIFVKYIEIFDSHKRKGYGTELLKQLQRLYPNTELEFGNLTDSGIELIKSLQFKKIKIPNVYTAKKYLENLKKQINELDKKFENLPSIENRTKDMEKQIDNMIRSYYSLEDKIRQLEKSYGNMKSEKRLIKYEK